MTYPASAEEYGNAVAIDLFLSMLNPKYRGPKFSWNKLEGMAVRQAEAGVFTAFTKDKYEKYKTLIIPLAAKAAKEKIQSILKHTAVQEWHRLE